MRFFFGKNQEGTRPLLRNAGKITDNPFGATDARPVSAGKGRRMPSETVVLQGHIIDSLTLSKVLDLILREGGQYHIARFEIGATRVDTSRAQITVTAPDEETLETILHLIQQRGAERATREVDLAAAPADGVFPDGFYATTNLETCVRYQGRWLPVENIEMDCGVVIEGEDEGVTARTVPMHRARAGQRIVVGDSGIRVTPPAPADPTDA